MESMDMTSANTNPIKISNRLYILGDPCVPVETLEQLVNALDTFGESQPVVIINPRATTVPNFNQLLSNLIQNNRTRQAVNVTTEDKYRFKDLTDDQLRVEVEKAISFNPTLDFDSLLDIYTGLRARAQALYSLELLCYERDALWNEHCANPSSPIGFDRYHELSSSLIPQAQQYYDWVCSELQKREVSHTNMSAPAEAQAEVASEPAIESPPKSIVETPVEETRLEEPDNSTEIDKLHNVHIWGPWNTILNMQMPLSAAKQAASSPSYAGLVAQQRDVNIAGRTYTAVEPEWLLALGIKTYPDGVPVVYTNIGTFRRIGNSDRPINDLDYWYPKPMTCKR